MRQRRTPVLVDLLLAAGLTVPTVVTLLTQDGRGVDAIGWVLALASVAPIALRQLAPVLTLVTIAVAMGLFAVLGQGDWPSAGLGLLVALFTVATLRPAREVAVLLPLPLGVLVLGWLSTDGVTVALVWQGALAFVCAWALGAATRGWAAAAEAAAARAARAVAEERTRMARELHDVVAHHMSVVTLQAGLASYVLEPDPAAARRAIGHADDAAREALRDMRRMLDALRTEEDPAPREPQPGLDRLDALADRVRATGLAVDLHVHGDVGAVGAGAQLCAFRVVQESLTNVLKHAGPGAAATVTVAHEDGRLTVEVADDGPGTARRPGTHGGHGIRGMRERAALFGGVLEAGPRPAGGFRVALRLPTTSAAEPVAT